MNAENARITMKMLPFIDFTKYCSPRVSTLGNKKYIQFQNITRSDVGLIWHDFNGELKKYRTILPEHSLNIITYFGHIFSFVDETTGDRLVDDKNNYYVTVQRSELSQGDTPEGEVVKIKTPLLNLQELCYKVVRNELVFNNNESINEQLNCLPRNVFDELKLILLKGMTYVNRVQCAERGQEEDLT